MDALKNRIADISEFLKTQHPSTEYDEPLVRRLIDKVTVKGQIHYQFKSGLIEKKKEKAPKTAGCLT